MSDEEKKAIEIVQGLKVYYDNECLLNEEELEENKTVNNAIDTLINLVEKQQKELNSLKEIEQQHKTNNGLLRQELDIQIEHIKELEATLKQTQDSWFEDTQKLEQEKEKNKDLEEKLKITIAILTKGTYPEENEGDNDFDKYFISKDKIRELLENEIIDISGFRCIAVEDIEELLEEK